jgi:hypothetical protein
MIYETSFLRVHSGSVVVESLAERAIGPTAAALRVAVPYPTAPGVSFSSSLTKPLLPESFRIVTRPPMQMARDVLRFLAPERGAPPLHSGMS